MFNRYDNFSVWTANTKEGIGIIVNDFRAGPKNAMIEGIISSPDIFAKIRGRYVTLAEETNKKIQEKRSEIQNAKEAMLTSRRKNGEVDFQYELRMKERIGELDVEINQLSEYAEELKPEYVRELEDMYRGNENVELEYERVESPQQTERIERNKKYGRIVTAIGTMITIEKPVMKILYTASDVPELNPTWRITDYLRKNLSILPTGKDDLTLPRVAVSAIQNKWKEWERAAIFGGILKDGKILPLSVVVGDGPMSLLNISLQPNDTIELPYVMIANYASGYPSDNAVAYYEKLKAKGDLTPLGSYPAAGWDKMIFTKERWNAMSLALRTIEKPKSGNGRFIYEAEYLKSDTRIYIVSKDKLPDNLSPNELTAIAGPNSFEFKLFDNESYNVSKVKQLMEKFDSFSGK